MLERMRKAHPFHRSGVSKAHKMGIKVITGTDGGPASIINELCELVDCGFSHSEAITAATLKTAEAFGISHRTGSLEEGKRADLIVLGGEPDADIKILRSGDAIALVTKRGIIVKNTLCSDRY